MKIKQIEMPHRTIIGKLDFSQHNQQSSRKDNKNLDLSHPMRVRELKQTKKQK